MLNKFLPRPGQIQALLFFSLFSLISCGERSSKQQSVPGIAQTGPELFSRYACMACHSLEGKEMYGPSLNDLYMKDVRVVRQGQTMTVKADRKYLIRSIEDPAFEKDSAYHDKTMPVPDIPGGDVKILVDYIILLNEGKAPSATD